ncbi:MAG: cryptochrome/photolyase family protein [Pseudomonadota bacterium]
MVAPRLVLVLGDQLSQNIAALKAADKARDLVVMAEVAEEGTYVRHHKKKIVLVLAAMRKFAEELRRDGWDVAYTRLDDPENTGTILGELLRRASERRITEVLATEPGEFRLIAALSDGPLTFTLLDDDRFVASHQEFEAWAAGKKQLRMEYFYREMRRKTQLLMDGDHPAGGKWNYDSENRKPAKDDLLRPEPIRFQTDDTVRDVVEIVESRFADHPGQAVPFWFATDRTQALAALDFFVENHLVNFGDYQDAMLQSDRFLHHSLLSAYISIGLLDPLEVCQKVEAAYENGKAPLNATEGFIRQIIGWREYMRGIYFLKGPSYTQLNFLNASRPLPAFFWSGEIDLNCLKTSICDTLEEAYAHHIQRLMVIGNFALLAGVNPYEVHEWYLAVYWDAFEWVEAPNVIGMSQFADGGVVASKPYISSGAYIDRMSDYCGTCQYSPKIKMGEGACPFNVLYWNFLETHSDIFSKNPRMAQIYAGWRKRKAEDRQKILADAETFLSNL